MLLAFIPMYSMGLNANLMSLAGIAISIGVLVDGAIVEVENAYNKHHHWHAAGRKGDFHKVRLEALMEVGPSVFFSLLVIAVAFMPVFTLVDQEGRLFRPLAYSKNLTMAIAALLAITLDPALRMLFARIEPFRFRPRPLSWVATRLFVGTYRAEDRHPVNRLLHPPVRAAVPLRRAPRVGHRVRGRRGGRERDPPLPASSARSSCRRCARARCCTCPRRSSPGSRWPRRKRRCRRRTRS